MKYPSHSAYILYIALWKHLEGQTDPQRNTDSMRLAKLKSPPSQRQRGLRSVFNIGPAKEMPCYLAEPRVLVDPSNRHSLFS